jgi:NAD(P)-dependent dehydrogenase (short-subunit alcohol dehydrogenase family)
MKLEGKTILVTGSTSGIGEAIARKCHAEGANIVLHGLNKEEGESVCSSLGNRVMFHLSDLTNDGAPKELVQKAVDTFGGLDALVNNAAVFPRATIEHTDAELFDATMAVNARAPLLLCKAAADELEKTQGVIVNIGSINAYCGEANLLVYSMSKGALMTMTRSLGEYLQYTKGICSYQLNLGWVLSENERQRKIDEGLPENWFELQPREVSPHGKLLTPDQIATMAFPFVSGDMRPTSGSVIELEQYPIIGRNPTKE